MQKYEIYLPTTRNEEAPIVGVRIERIEGALGGTTLRDAVPIISRQVTAL